MRRLGARRWTCSSPRPRPRSPSTGGRHSGSTPSSRSCSPGRRAGTSEASLAPLMQDLPKEAQRIVCTAAAGAAADLVERYARRALTLGAAPAGRAPAPVGPVRTVAVSWERRASALADLVELLDPASLTVWTADRARHAAIARALPLGRPRHPGGHRRRAQGRPGRRVRSADARSAPPAPRRRRRRAAGPAGHRAYVERIASPRRPLRLPGLLDAVTTAAAARRAADRPRASRPARRTERCSRSRRCSSATIRPRWRRRSTSCGPRAGTAGRAPVPDIPATAQVYVGVGKKDGATVNDLVAVLTKEVRVERGRSGGWSCGTPYAGGAAGAGGGAGRERAERHDHPAEADHRAGGPGRPPRRPARPAPLREHEL